MRGVLLSCCVCLLLCAALGSAVYRREQEESPVSGNGTVHTPDKQGNDTASVTRFNNIGQYMPTIKSVFIFACGFSTFLIACLIVKIFRSGKRIRKTRKYDIITTPAERVEMAPLNEDNFEDEDSTVFDVKYRYSIVDYKKWSFFSIVYSQLLQFSRHKELIPSDAIFMEGY